MLQHHHDEQAAMFRLAGAPMLDDTPIFHDTDNKPLGPNTVTRAWTTLVAKAGLKPIRLHDARHTHASLVTPAERTPQGYPGKAWPQQHRNDARPLFPRGSRISGVGC